MTGGRGAAVEVGMVTADAERLAEFYERGFGWRVQRRLTFPEGLVLRLVDGSSGAARAKLYQPAGGALPPPERPTWHHHAGFAYAAAHVADAQATVQAAELAGATVLTPVTSHRPGSRFALIADPQGNVWEILEETPGDAPDPLNDR